MHVESAACRDVQEVLLQHVAVVEGKQEIGLQGADLRNNFRRVGIVRRNDGDVVPRRQFGHTVEPDGFVGVVAVGDDQIDLDAVGEQDREAADTYVVVGEDDGVGRGGHICEFKVQGQGCCATLSRSIQRPKGARLSAGPGYAALLALSKNTRLPS